MIYSIIFSYTNTAHHKSNETGDNNAASRPRKSVYEMHLHLPWARVPLMTDHCAFACMFGRIEHVRVYLQYYKQQRCLITWNANLLACSSVMRRCLFVGYAPLSVRRWCTAACSSVMYRCMFVGDAPLPVRRWCIAACLLVMHRCLFVGDEFAACSSVMHRYMFVGDTTLHVYQWDGA